MTRDFRLQVFIMIQFPPGPYPLGAISNCYKNSQRYSQTVHKLFTGVNDSSDKLWPVSLLPCDKLLPVSFTLVIKHCPVFLSIS